MTRHGGCFCGRLRFAVEGEPVRSGVCHCLDCRKLHGSLFHASAIFPETAVKISGEAREYEGRYFCPACGSQVYGRSEGEVLINLGAFDLIDRFRPTYELWTVRREAWLPAFDGMTLYAHDREDNGPKKN